MYLEIRNKGSMDDLMRFLWMISLSSTSEQ